MAITKTLYLAIYASAFLKQKEVILDKSRRKVLFVPRRGAKTFTIALYLILIALSKPKVKLLYLGLTRESAENALWKDCLLKIFTDHGLVEGDDYTYNRNLKTITFNNSSTIRMTGADTSFKEPTKLLGGKYFMAIIDECQNYMNDLENIILSVLGPAVSDYINQDGGQIILAGTAGPYMGKHYWHQVNTNPQLGWKIFAWQGKDNPFMKEQKEIEEADFLKQYGPDYVITDWYQQQYLCKWILPTTNLIYKYTPANLLSSVNCIDSATRQRIPFPSREFLLTATYILGIDLGYNDPTALTVVAYNLGYSNKLYVVETFNKSEMLISEVAAKIKLMDAQYHFTYMVGDSSSLQVFESLKQNYSLPIEKANRAGKLSHQLILNSDLQTKNIVIMPGNDGLINQMQTCTWLKAPFDEGQYDEDPRHKNDQVDSFLYAHNFSRHLWFREPKPILSQEDRFTQAILKGEKAATRQNILTYGKERLNPYSRNYGKMTRGYR